MNSISLMKTQSACQFGGEIREHNKSLAEAAQMAGIETPQEYAVFQNKGYQGLYGGLGVKEIHKRKGLKKSQKNLTIWAAQSLRPICSARPRPMKKTEETR